VMSYNGMTRDKVFEVIKNYEANPNESRSTDTQSCQSLRKISTCNVLLPWNFNGKDQILKFESVKNLDKEAYFKLPDKKPPMLLSLEYISITCINMQNWIESNRTPDPKFNSDTKTTDTHSRAG
jgi:uncharacterized protein YxeA